MRAIRTPLSRGMLLATFILTPPLAGCAASQLGNMWRDETFKTDGMKNVLVVAMRKDQVRRRLWEDSFASGLTAYGAKATQSYRLFSDAVPDTQQVIEAVRRDGYDGVLVAMRSPDSHIETWIAGYTRRESETRQNPFTGAYYTYWKDVDVPARVETNAVANFETDVWTTGDGGRLVWSGHSHTTDGVNLNVINHQTAKLILPELAKTGVLAAKAKK